MRLLVLILALLGTMTLAAQPQLVNTTPYTPVQCMAFDSVNNKMFYNFRSGCPTWNMPCALNYTLSGQHNIINKHDFTDNSVSTAEGSKYQIATPDFPVNNVASGYASQSIHENGFVYTNFGYYFNKIQDNLALPGAIWSYSPASNPSYKEISTFQIKGDSIFLFQKDSISSQNFYTVLLRNKLNGATIPYNSLIESNPTNSLGAIEGYINSSVIIGNKIVLAGVFTASVSGVLIARNIVALDIPSGQLQATGLSFDPGTAIYDMKKHNNKIFLAGKFVNVSGFLRLNFAVMDLGLSLTNETCPFDGNPGTWVDKIVFYDRYMIAKGNYASVNGSNFSFWNTYVVKAVDIENYYLTGWNIDLPGTPQVIDNTFEMYKNKLYIKNRTYAGSSFYIYCFNPVNIGTTIFYPGSTIPNPSPSIAVCAPDNGDANVFVAPIRYASVYTWSYTGTNATVVPQGNGSSVKLVLAANATNGVLSVMGYNDCGLSSTTSTLNVIVNSKPTFTLPSSPKLIICNPDSTLLQTTTTNTNAGMYWRKVASPTQTLQPYYAKTAGNYYSIVTDNSNGCKDSGAVVVDNYKVYPNAKITSHVYPGALTPIDTVTCFQPSVSITAASDTAGVAIAWKSISTNSVYTNPLFVSTQNNLKVIVTRTNNMCVDSSLIVLVGQNTIKPSIAIANYTNEINCSFYTATLNAIVSPSNCSTIWNGPQVFTSTNPGITSGIGKYFVSATNPANGCTKNDSAYVNYTNKFILKTSSDTIVCKQSQINLNATAIGTVSPITYSWNTGSIINSVTANPASSFNFVVYANGPGGCFGADTIKVNVPSDIIDSTLAYRSCNNESTGTIVIFAKGGIAPYKYSINNGITFSAVNSFTGLPFGGYTIIIKDSIGCTRTNSVTLNANSSLPVPKFLASTKNFKADTIVLVDISIPKADSVSWILPAQCQIIGGNMFNPVVVASDTGSFEFTMRSYYGNCIINTTKQVRFSNSDSLSATHYNANGIKTFSLYPNPNTGVFTLAVEFYKKQNSTVQVWDTSPYKYLQQNFYEVSTINLPVNLSQLQNGSYILRLIGEFDSKNSIFIISK